MSKPEIEIRPLVEHDLPSLHKVREAAFAPVFESFRMIVGDDVARFAYANAEDGQGQYLDEICRTDSGHTVLVAVTDDETVGFCSYSIDARSKVGTIGLNAVHPDHDGRGIGTALYEQALIEMRELGMAAATVGTGGDPSHAPARRAYRKAGFDRAIPSVSLFRTL